MQAHSLLGDSGVTCCVRCSAAVDAGSLVSNVDDYQGSPVSHLSFYLNQRPTVSLHIRFNFYLRWRPEEVLGSGWDPQRRRKSGKACWWLWRWLWWCCRRYSKRVPCRSVRCCFCFLKVRRLFYISLAIQNENWQNYRRDWLRRGVNGFLDLAFRCVCLYSWSLSAAACIVSSGERRTLFFSQPKTKLIAFDSIPSCTNAEVPRHNRLHCCIGEACATYSSF